MAIAGPSRVREYRRYASETARSDRADAAMSKVMANRFEKLVRSKEQGIKDAAQNQARWMPREDSNLN